MPYVRPQNTAFALFHYLKTGVLQLLAFLPWQDPKGHGSSPGSYWMTFTNASSQSWLKKMMENLANECEVLNEKMGPLIPRGILWINQKIGQTTLYLESWNLQMECSPRTKTWRQAVNTIPDITVNLQSVLCRKCQLILNRVWFCLSVCSRV